MDFATVLYVFSGGACVASLIAALYFHKRAQEFALLAGHDGVPAEGRVAEKLSRKTKNGTQYSVRFTFPTLEDASTEGISGVSHDAWMVLAEGDEISVTYLRFKPSVYCLSESFEQALKMRKMLPFVLALGGLGFPLMVYLNVAVGTV